MPTQALVCPLCRGQVAPSSSGCVACQLPMRDLVDQRTRAETPRIKTLARSLGIRLWGILLYGAAVAWCAYQLPTSLAFVVPGAVLGGGILHVWKGRPWLGLIVFTVIVVAVPALIAPSMVAGTFADLTEGR